MARISERLTKLERVKPDVAGNDGEARALLMARLAAMARPPMTPAEELASWREIAAMPPAEAGTARGIVLENMRAIAMQMLEQAAR